MSRTINYNSYTIEKLQRANTERLMDIHVKLFDAFPNTFDRQRIISAILVEVRRRTESAEDRRARRAAAAQKQAQWFMTWLKDVQRGQFGQEDEMTEQDVRTIRWMREDGHSYNAIAKMFGKQANYIRNICIRKIWKHVQ